MNLQSKHILPKSQMLINSLLSDKQTENHQLNFSHQEYSIQIKNSHLLSINYYEPDLQDIEWNVQFLGVTDLRHVAISQYKRKRVRLAYIKNNVVYFYEGNLEPKEDKLNLKQSLLNSQQTILLSNIRTDDSVEFISSDLTPEQKAGLYLICTEKSHFYVLKANSNRHQLIDLNPSTSFNRFYEQIKNIFTKDNKKSSNNQNKQVLSYLSLMNPNHQEEFRFLLLRDFIFESRFVSIPIIPGDKCQRQISLKSSLNLADTIKQYLQIHRQSSLNILQAKIYHMNEVEIALIYLLKVQNIMEEQHQLVSIIYHLQKEEIRSIHDFPILSMQSEQIEFKRIPDTDEIILKAQRNKEIVLTHLTIETLQIISSTEYPTLGSTLLTESTTNSKLILLSSYHIFDINMAPPSGENLSEMQEQVEIHKTQRTGIESQLRDILNRTKITSDKMKNFYEKGKITQFDKVTASLQADMDLYIRQKLANNNIDKDLQNVFHIYVILTMYKSLVHKLSESSFFTTSSEKKGRQLTFRDLVNKNQQEIYHVLSTFSHTEQDFTTFIEFWISFIQELKTKEYFENDHLRGILYFIIKEDFTSLIDNILRKFIGTDKEAKQQQKLTLQSLRSIDQETQNLLIKFVKSTSGLIKIQRDNYRFMINQISRKDQLKGIAIDVVNVDLLAIFYFQQGNISVKQLQRAFNIVKPKKHQIIDSFIRSFLEQLMGRVQKRDKIHTNAQNIGSLFTVFHGHEHRVKQILQQYKSDLHILLGLKLGQRQQLKQEILDLSQRLKNDSNKQKLLLTLYNPQQGQKMDEQ